MEEIIAKTATLFYWAWSSPSLKLNPVQPALISDNHSYRSTTSGGWSPWVFRRTGSLESTERPRKPERSSNCGLSTLTLVCANVGIYLRLQSVPHASLSPRAAALLQEARHYRDMALVLRLAGEVYREAGPRWQDLSSSRGGRRGSFSRRAFNSSE